MIRFVKGERVTRVERGDRVRCRTCGRRRAAFAAEQRQCAPCRRLDVREYQRRYRITLGCGTCNARRAL